MSHDLKDYHYDYPAELVAQCPIEPRDASRMLVLDVGNKNFFDSQFNQISNFLKANDLLLVNNTEVRPSRLFVQKPTGGLVEIFLLHQKSLGQWSAFLSPRRGLREGLKLPVFSRPDQSKIDQWIELISLNPKEFVIRFDSPENQWDILNRYGEMPLPPYIKRLLPKEEDFSSYQTMFAQKPGAVAAPTAGLHFTESIWAELQKRQIQSASVTLHVGAGTFLPIKTRQITEHNMHQEYYEISDETLKLIEQCRRQRGRVVVVGTTTLRALESFAMTSRQQGWTDLFIQPGFRFQLTDCLLTNFHQPTSTLLVLVSALAGREFILNAYRHAIQEKYRLWSYGDCMLIQKN